jgi:DNA-binding XRE family transcriptional regulator
MMIDVIMFWDLEEITVMKRVHRKTHRTPEEKGRLQAVRDTFQAERPSLDALIASGDYTEPVKHGVTLDALRVAALLKHAREEAHLSLADVSDRCGLDRSAISRLENGLYENTTLNTLHRLAEAYGKRFIVQLVDAGQDASVKRQA